MKIADGLLLQKDLAEEVSRLRQLAKQEAWEYRSMSGDHPDAKWVPSFDLEANRNEVKRLSRLHRKLGRAISRANNTVDLPGVDDADYADWL